jgi:hypothetical protein
MHVYVYIRIHVYMHICTHIHTYINIYIHISLYTEHAMERLSSHIYTTVLLPTYMLPLKYFSWDFECFEIVAAPVYKTEIMSVRVYHADYSTFLYLQKLALTSPTIGGHSVGIVRSRTQAKEFKFKFECFVLSIYFRETSLILTNIIFARRS